MATDGSDGPRGLNMSLDQIIAENNKSKKLQHKNANSNQHAAKSNHLQHNARGGGRGGRGTGRGSARGGRFFGRGGRGQQQHAQNDQLERVVVVQEQLPNDYRQVAMQHNNDHTFYRQNNSDVNKVCFVACSTKTAIEMNMAMLYSHISTPSLSRYASC